MTEASGKIIKDSKFIADKLFSDQIETAKQLTQNIMHKKE